MVELDRSVVEGAVQKRAQYILDNIQTLSLKQCRKLLEEDLGLPEKGLNAFKELVQELVEKIVMSGSTSLPSKGPASLGKGATVPKIKDKGNQKGSQADHGQSSKSKRKTKGSSDVDHESKRGQKKAKRGSRKDDKSRKRTIEVEEDDDDENSDGSSEDEPTKRKAKRSKAAPKPSGKSERSAAVQTLQGILKKATIPIPPALYVKHKSDADLAEALEELLNKHGLHKSADPRQIEKVKKKLQINRDLEGIDPSNILEDTGRGARRAATRGVNYAAVMAGPKLELEGEEEEDDDEEDEEDDEDEDEGNDEEGWDAGDDDDGAEQESDKEEPDDDDDDHDDDGGSEDEVKEKKRSKATPKARLKTPAGQKETAERSSGKRKSKVQESLTENDPDEEDGSPDIKRSRKTLQAWSDDDE